MVVLLSQGCSTRAGVPGSGSPRGAPKGLGAPVALGMALQLGMGGGGVAGGWVLEDGWNGSELAPLCTPNPLGLGWILLVGLSKNWGKQI